MSALNEHDFLVSGPQRAPAVAEAARAAGRQSDLEFALTQHQDAVIEALELLRGDVGPSAPGRRTLDTALREARRATKLLSRLAELSEGNVGTRFRDLLVGTAQLAMERFPQGLRLVVPSRLPEVAGDIALIQNVVAHIIKRAAGPSGSVEVSARQLHAGAAEARLAGPAVVVRAESVPCDGKRVDPSTATVEELELLVGKDAATECRAYLVGYTSPGIGLRFELHLPMPELRPPARIDWRANRRALVVEGDPTLVQRVHEMLGGLGWEVDLASGRTETLAIYERARMAGRPYGLVILDARSCQERSEIHDCALIIRLDAEVQMVLCTDDPNAHAGQGKSHLFDIRLARPPRFIDLHRMLA